MIYGLISLFLTIGLFNVAGILGVIPLLLGLYGFQFYLKWRGGRFLRAYCFLALLGNGKSVVEANSIAITMSKTELAEHEETAIYATNDLYGGSQTKVIQTARLMGFAR